MQVEEEDYKPKEPIYEKELPDYAQENPKAPPVFQPKSKALIIQTNAELELLTLEMAAEAEVLILFFPMNYSDREEHLNPENLLKFGKKLPWFTKLQDLQILAPKQDHKCPIYNVVRCNLKIDHMAAEHCEKFLRLCLQMSAEQLDQLKSFAMYVDYIYMSKRYFETLKDFLKRAQNISKIQLSFKNSKITNEMLEILADSLSQTLNYEDLYLNLDYNDDLISEVENDTFIEPQFRKIILKNVNLHSCHICLANTRHLPVEFLYPIMNELESKKTHKNLINYNIDFGDNAGKCIEYNDKQDAFRRDILRERKGKLYQAYAFFQKRIKEQGIIGRPEIINDFAELL